MKCWRIDLRRSFSLYVTGELEASAVKRVEDHLLDCGSCRTRLARLRNGHRFAQEMPRFTPQLDPWTAIEAAIDARQPNSAPDAGGGASWRRLVLKPGFALAVIGMAALIAALIVVSGGDLSFKLVDELGRPGPFIICEIIDPIKLAPPSVGSRVRVYGVSRYDGQADHNWYEVHPVLNIEVVRR